MVTETRIYLSASWAVLMLIYLWGDVLRLMSGNVVAGELGDGVKGTPTMYLFISALMLIPILMVFLSLVLPYDVARWANIILAAFFFLMNITSIHTYPAPFDRFLLAVSLVFNVLTIAYAWRWEGL